ncbi:MAG: N-acetylmuramoyl-L-alanine amidase [Bacteroidia bacterium]|nr:N-acetylmuramoyl-L-alanine amidase [Bacteroidia bacterium]
MDYPHTFNSTSAMWNNIIEFFKSIFSSPDPIVEDAAQLNEEIVLEEYGPSPEELADRAAAAQRSRGGLASAIGETIEVNPNGGESISIETPRYYWLLDNGHGELQSGKRSPKFEDGTRFEEWEFTRDIVARMIPKLDQAGVQYLNVVPETQVGSFLRERVARANSASHPLGIPPIFVSIHANAFGMGDAWSSSESARGLEMWHFPESNTGMRIASVFQRELLKALPTWRDRGIKAHKKGSRNVFYVLQNTSMPAVLTENGFYTNKEETELLRRDDIRQLIADAHVAAILHIEQNGWENEPIHRPNMVLA